MPDQSLRQDNLNNIRSLQHLFAAHRVPASGSINLTNRCNLNCIHCYLGNRDSHLRSPEKELTTDQWFTVIDQITEAGCLYLLLSGGEVLLRPDFAAIYRKAATSGLLVTVFTNGTLLNEETYALFIDLPPQSIEISLYGAKPETYEAVTGVKGSFQKCLAGIQGLHDHQVRFNLKAMILVQNHREIDKIEQIAQGFGVEFRMDPAVSACLDGNQQPMRCRVDPAAAVQAEISTPEKASRWQQYYNQRKKSPATEYLYNCGAGLTNFHIEPDGTLSPCMMLNRPSFDLTKGSFKDGWTNELIKLRKIKAGNNYLCNTCDINILCSGCPATFELESGSSETCSQYMCDIAKCRQEAINSHLHVEDCSLK